MQLPKAPCQTSYCVKIEKTSTEHSNWTLTRAEVTVFGFLITQPFFMASVYQPYSKADSQLPGSLWTSLLLRRGQHLALVKCPVLGRDAGSYQQEARPKAADKCSR